MVHEIESFHGVYLLYNLNERYKGRTYIGYTVDPNRRIKQHNTGAHAGGAYRTSGKGPWEMVLIIHGFPNEISGLRFEWAWQHPEKSRRLKHLSRKSKKEKQFDYRFRIVSEMLRTAPWDRLCLTVRWLKQEFSRDFDPSLTPPLHMAIAYGPVKSKKLPNESKRKKKDNSTKEDCGDGGVPSPEKIKSNSAGEERESTALVTSPARFLRCAVCNKLINNSTEQNNVTCYRPRCPMMAHITCLAERFLGNQREGAISHMLPVQGSCPRCSQNLLWGDIIRHKRGCYQNLAEPCDSDQNVAADDDDDHWANELQTQPG